MPARPRDNRPTAAAPTLVLFAEGANGLNGRHGDPLVHLWTRLTKLCGGTAPSAVIGFSKHQILKLKEPVEVRRVAPQALDLLVAGRYDLQNFDRAIVAFDAFPKNQEVLEKDCMHDEIDFVLRHFATCPQLAPKFRQAADTLRARYAVPEAQRQPYQRSPSCLEIIYMQPTFEGIFACDEDTVKRALLGPTARRPNGWPDFDATDPRPAESLLPRAVECAREEARRIVRGSFKTNKHAWAEFILREASASCEMLKHDIATRLSFAAR